MAASTEEIQSAYSRLEQEITSDNSMEARIAVADLLRIAARKDAKAVIWAQHTAKRIVSFTVISDYPGAIQKLSQAARTLVFNSSPYANHDPQDIAQKASKTCLTDEVLNNMASKTWNPFSPTVSVSVIANHIMTQIGLPPSELVPTVPYLPAIKKEIGPYDRGTLEKAWDIYQENISRRYRDTFGRENLPAQTDVPWVQDAITLIDGLQRPATEEESLTAIRELASSSYSYAGGSETINACLNVTAYNKARQWLAHALNDPKVSHHIDLAVQSADQYLTSHPIQSPSIFDWDKAALQAINNEKIFPPQILDNERNFVSSVCTITDLRPAADSLALDATHIALNEVQNTVKRVEKHNRKDPFHKRHIVY